MLNLKIIPALSPALEWQNALKTKHPDYSVMVSTFEQAPTATYDTLLGLYGVASYIPNTGLSKVVESLNDNGGFILMVYKSDYTPDIYSEAEKKTIHDNDDYKALKLTDNTRLYRFNNFVISSNVNLELQEYQGEHH